MLPRRTTHASPRLETQGPLRSDPRRRALRIQLLGERLGIAGLLVVPVQDHQGRDLTWCGANWMAIGWHELVRSSRLNPEHSGRQDSYSQCASRRAGEFADVLRRRRSRSDPDSDGSERLRSLIEDHSAAAYRVALGVVRDPSMAEDVVQEAMIRAWGAIDTHDGSGSERSWVLSIAHNTAVSMLRRSRDASTDPDDLPDRPSAINPERVAEGRDDLRRVTAALDGLDELSRTIVIMRDLEGMSYQLISEALGVTIPTVKTRLLRARRELQRVVSAGEPA